MQKNQHEHVNPFAEKAKMQETTSMFSSPQKEAAATNEVERPMASDKTSVTSKFSLKLIGKKFPIEQDVQPQFFRSFDENFSDFCNKNKEFYTMIDNKPKLLYPADFFSVMEKISETTSLLETLKQLYVKVYWGLAIKRGSYAIKFFSAYELDKFGIASLLTQYGITFEAFFASIDPYEFLKYFENKYFEYYDNAAVRTLYEYEVQHHSGFWL